MLTADTTNNASNGWLSPDGRLFPCQSWGHMDLCEEICREFGFSADRNAMVAVLMKGYLQLRNYQFIVDEEITQRQYDAIWEYGVAQGHFKHGGLPILHSYSAVKSWDDIKLK